MIDNNSTLKNLKLLWLLRNIAIAGQTIAVIVVIKMLDIPLTEKPLWFIIAGLVITNIITFFRIKWANNISQIEFLGQLMIDIFALFGLLYFTGGATNPFAPLFILQVIIAAIILKPLYTWSVATLTIILYTILMFYNVEVPYFMHHHIGDFFSLHVQGMWISFILLATIIAWFIVRMNQIIYRQNNMLMEAEKMAALGTLAASAAHELGTPLATMAILTEELNNDMRQQFFNHIKKCKEIISHITLTGGINKADSGTKMHLEIFLKEILQTWQLKNPEAKVNAEINDISNIEIIAEQNLKQALWNLLDNAFEESPDYIVFNAKCVNNKLHINIIDNGNGIPKSIKNYVGEAGVTTKENGMGLGLFLSKSVITRLDGTLTIENLKTSGASCNIVIPIRSIAL